MSEINIRQNVCDLKVKDSVESSYLIKYISLMEGRDGRPYLNLILSDKTGDIESRVWNCAMEVSSQFTKGGLIFVKGKVNQYQGRKQLIISDVSAVEEGTYDNDDFIFTSDKGPDEMYQQLLEIVEGLDDVYIRELLRLVLNDHEISKRLKVWPAAKTIHHAYQSGLLEHILSCTKLSVTLSVHYDVNVNYVVAGAILHDLCKIYELSSGMTVDYTEEGKLIGHLVKGLEVVDKYTYRIKNFPIQTKTHLKHIILSHHGEYEYGSPKLPQTKEAYLLHLIDYMDSKMGALDLIRKTDSNVGHWSSFVKHLDRIVFKGELPHHEEFIIPQEYDESKGHNREQIKRGATSKKSSHSKEGPQQLKNSMGDLLKNIKISEDK